MIKRVDKMLTKRINISNSSFTKLILVPPPPPLLWNHNKDITGHNTLNCQEKNHRFFKFRRHDHLFKFKFESNAQVVCKCEMLYYSAQFLLHVYYRANTDSGFRDSSRDAHDGQWLFLVQFVNQIKRVSIMCLWQINWVFIEIYVHLGHFPIYILTCQCIHYCQNLFDRFIKLIKL